MLHPIKIVDIELTQSIPTLEGLSGYMGVQGLIRLHGVPLGYVKAPVTLDRCTAATLGKLILEQHSQAIINQLLKNGLASPQGLNGLTLEDLIDLPPAEYTGEWPLVTVAVCTRDRPDDMKLCLEAISRLDYPHLDILVVDNAPQTETTKELVVAHYPQVRYVREPRPGLDWARNRAILEAKGEIIAYTDDDVVVDEGWVRGLAKAFSENSEVMAITGLVVPYELETEAQVLFEEQGGFGKGFERKWYQAQRDRNIPWYLLGTGNFGTGANMAYRRSVFDKIGFFDPALDVGTVTNGSGDLEMFYRVLKSKGVLVYEPNAVIRHRHRRSYEKLRSQIQNNGSVLSYFVCATMAYPEDFLSFVRVAISWLKSYHLPQLVSGFFHPKRYPMELVWIELKGCFIGLTRYPTAKRQAKEIETQYKDLEIDVPKHRLPRSPSLSTPLLKEPIGLRKIEITQPVLSLNDLSQYPVVRVFVTFDGIAIGNLDIENNYQSVGRTRLCDVIAKNIGARLIEPNSTLNEDFRRSQSIKTLTERYAKEALSQVKTDLLPPLPPTVSVSVVIGTFDRPEDLRSCLQCLTQQNSPRLVEIIVVDNHPASNITPSVVAEYPEVRLISEARQGVAYARNAGIAKSTGDIIVTIDDDVMMSSNWLERLISPFSRADVMGVTGNVLPRILDTASQRLFEEYGGLGRGFGEQDVSTLWFERSWYHCVPTWELGGTANAAFRASAFHHPDIGLMNEPLGPGMPSGVGEDIYLFYKVLKAGYTILYEPDAQVWHTHRRTPAALRRQLYNYSKGFVSYQMTTLLLDKDLRSLVNLFFYLPFYHLKRIYGFLRGFVEYPVSLIFLEIAGNLAGPWSLWSSYRRVWKTERSESYVPVQQRTLVAREKNCGSPLVEP